MLTLLRAAQCMHSRGEKQNGLNLINFKNCDTYCRQTTCFKTTFYLTFRFLQDTWSYMFMCLPNTQGVRSLFKKFKVVPSRSTIQNGGRKRRTPFQVNQRAKALAIAMFIILILSSYSKLQIPRKQRTSTVQQKPMRKNEVKRHSLSVYAATSSSYMYIQLVAPKKGLN